MRKEALIALGEQAASAFMARHKLTDRHPRISETFNYAAAGACVTIEADGAANTWDIEIHAGRAVVAVWRSASDSGATFAPDLGDHWPLFIAAMNAAARGDLILEVAPAA